MKVILKTKVVNPGFGPQIVVMNGKKHEAKINHPNKYNPKEFVIETSGLAFYRPTKEAALEFVRKSFEDRMNAFGNVITAVIEEI